jgi:hypothetical protein
VTVAFALDSMNMQAPARTASRSTSQESESGGFADQLQEATKSDPTKPKRTKEKAQENKQPRKDDDPTVVVPPILLTATSSAPFSLDCDPASSGDVTGQPRPETAKLASAEPASAAVVLTQEVVVMPGEPIFAPQSTKRPGQTDETATPLIASPGKAPLDLAFAARIKPASSVVAPAVNTHAPAQPQVLGGIIPAAQRKADIVDEPPAEAGGPQPLLQPVVAAYVRNVEPPPTSASQPEFEAPKAETLTTKVDERPKAVEPLRNLSIQLPRSNSDPVEVRLTQQSGEVHVAVRTADPDFANELREGLPDLVGRLRETGFRTDTWRPASGVPAGGPAPETQNTTSHTHGSDYQSNSGGSQQHGGQRNQNQQNIPRWVEELESSITAGAN